MDAKINPDLAQFAKPIETLKLDPKNARSHSERNIKLIADSLERFGQQKTIVIAPDKTILAGNATYLAAKGLGWKKIAAVTIDAKDEALRTAYGIMDNRTAELAEWDPTVLQSLIAELELQGIHAQQVGFEEAELTNLMARLNVQPPESFPEYGADMATNTTCPKCGYEFNAKGEKK